jgi:hypothetical protein
VEHAIDAITERAKVRSGVTSDIGILRSSL